MMIQQSVHHLLHYHLCLRLFILLLLLNVSSSSRRCKPGSHEHAAGYIQAGAEAYDNGKLDAAASCFELAARVNPQDGPSSAVALSNLATVKRDQGRVGEALELMRDARKMAPEDAETAFLLGKMLGDAGQGKEAILHLEHACHQDPSHFRAWSQLGVELDKAREHARALLMYEQAVKVKEDYLTAKVQIALAAGNLQDCERSRRMGREALGGIRGEVPYLSALATSFKRCGDREGEREAYLRALLLHPGAIFEVGGEKRTVEERFAALLAEEGKHGVAIQFLEKAKRQKEHHAPSLLSLLGFCYSQLGSRFYPEAMAALEKSCRLYESLRGEERKELGPVLGNLLRLKFVTGNWTRLNFFLSSFARIARESSRAEAPPPSNPVFVLAYPVDDSVLLSIAMLYAKGQRQKFAGATSLPLPRAPDLLELPAGKKLTIGFLAPGQGNGVGSHLASWSFWQHCKQSSRISCVLFSDKDEGEEGGRREVEHVQLTGELRRDASSLISKRFHVLLDIFGHTEGSRPELLLSSSSLPPVRMQFYGYEGSYGDRDLFPFHLSDWATAAVDAAAPPADPTAATPGMFVEKLVLLPPSKFPSGALPAAGDSLDEEEERRMEHMLFGTEGHWRRNETFVFCSFAKSYKLHPRLFKTWVSILLRSPNSILWLLSYPDGSDLARPRLREHAERMGLDPARLVVTGLLERKRHLLLKGTFAHLLLDSFPYNGHLTTAEALAAGIPVLALPQTRPASRLSSSMLAALQLHPRLVARDLEDYEELAVRIASSWNKNVTHSWFAETREELRRRRAVGEGFFDSRRYAEKFSQAMSMTWDLEENSETLGRRFHVICN
ncbi:hypothetical protein GUITHDRAFT_131413 [Guillardia theta CCMP2712]|uniref:protein O-GlcNAc transferase n=3 Tax=Guillardia theta TaxID=55529 RepID=L1K2T8_GUITC|nr:hypothetical protein GUITHDRAFT_131413 [Guillardia theta CCMP2712]EKX55141.1 hypothetical protein GUITHDRAFT_131413 [Guillardia theta CCMP2712]|eukprot:XP_005842121.1 hypothetical protein GUITHDRAFT_131413 [Guillardia theta CCMP2712]